MANLRALKVRAIRIQHTLAKQIQFSAAHYGLYALYCTSMALDFSTRSAEPEIMDDFHMSGHLLRESIDQIAGVNTWLGGDQTTFAGIERFIQPNQTITIVDIGCAGGHLCRKIAKWASKKQLQVQIIGIDANEDAIQYAQEQSKTFNNIHYQCANVFDPNFDFPTADIAVCTLTLHHFSNEEIVQLMNLIQPKLRLGIVINDLHRSRLAYRLYQLVCFVFGLNKMLRHDGCISILSGFKRKELEAFSHQLKLKNHSIRWRWAFRYQWIIPAS
ncbi:MAG: methyltransferase domain-containing protein [Saprospiraceae bacterium]|nr:methyltransferase domain-containing protein [Saprospiraceae bacterium]